jgi:HSP20 family molecular chaperone IbpA
MERRVFERMEREVCAIYRALTGEELRVEELEWDAELAGEEQISQRFTELAIAAREIPRVAAVLSDLGSVPPVDVVESDDEVIVEALVPGIAKGDIDVHVRAQALYFVGSRGASSDELRGESVGVHGVVVQREIPRGIFRRVVHLPCEVSPGSRVDVERGVVRIRLQKAVQPAALAPAGE